MIPRKAGTPSASPSLQDLLLTPLDPLLADATRLRLMAALIGLPEGGSISFTALRDLLGMTDGNLGMHLRVLVEMGYAVVTKERSGRRTQSFYATTHQGHAAFDAHVTALEAITTAAHGSHP